MYGVDYWNKWQNTVDNGARKKHEKKSPALKKPAAKKKNENRSHGFGSSDRTKTTIAVSANEQMIGKGCSSPTIRGGAMTRANRPSTMVTHESPGPGEYTAVASCGKQPLSSHLSAPRFSFPQSDSLRETETVSNEVSYDRGVGDKYLKNKSFTYSFSKASVLEKPIYSPGPGTYSPCADTPTCAAIVGPKRGTSSYTAITSSMKSEFHVRPVLDSSSFGYNCNEDEHLKFGMCMSGDCCCRGSWERKVDENGSQTHKESPVTHIIFSDTLHKTEYCDLLKHVDINQVDCEGKNVLHMLAEQEFMPFETQLPKLDVLLMTPEMDVNCRDQKGNTALHYAVTSEQTEMVEYLLRRQADAEVENNDGENPLQLAVRLEVDHKIYQLLRASTLINDLRAEVTQVRNRTRNARRRTPPSTPFGGLPSRGSMGEASVFLI